jgi:hypothetical protein
MKMPSATTPRQRVICCFEERPVRKRIPDVRRAYGASTVTAIIANAAQQGNAARRSGTPIVVAVVARILAGDPLVVAVEINAVAAAILDMTVRATAEADQDDA